MKLSLLIFISMLVLPCLAFSQQTDNKNIEYKPNVKMVAVKKQINTKDTILPRSTYIYSSEYRIANGVPSDFPKYIDTGNPKIDRENYHNAKQEWIKNNPSRFEKIKHLAL